MAKRIKVYDNVSTQVNSSSSRSEEVNDFYEDCAPSSTVSSEELPTKSIERCVDAELDLYKIEPRIPHKVQTASGFVYNNPLEWWKLNCGRFKVLSQMAREILCIPATSAPVERLFSAAGNTMAEDSCNLSPYLADDLIFLQDA